MFSLDGRVAVGLVDGERAAVGSEGGGQMGVGEGRGRVGARP